MCQPDSLKRNQLFWIKSEYVADLDYTMQFPHLDLGKIVADELTRNPPGKHVSLEIDAFLRKTLRQGLIIQELSIKGLVLTNLGILLEPDLALNPVKLFLELSTEAILILVWDHAIIDGVRFVWDEAAPEYGFLFPSHTITQMELPNEVP